MLGAASVAGLLAVLRHLGTNDAAGARPQVRADRQAADRLPWARVHRPRLGEGPSRAVQAAGLHDRLWTTLELLYENQGVENTGWVTDPLLRLVLDSSGLEPAAVLGQVDDPRVNARIAGAQRLGVPGTPFFSLGRTGGTLDTLRVTSLEPPEFEAAIAKVLSA
jgi:hypothetical protein